VQPRKITFFVDSFKQMTMHLIVGKQLSCLLCFFVHFSVKAKKWTENDETLVVEWQ
jgi:hypothetical protein